ncbi:MAG: hypothetical protein IPL50_08780 [Chitinophagaceae bacterium]|nr:hypothetical protein [Chitinophagaceae bacterium]
MEKLKTYTIQNIKIDEIKNSRDAIIVLNNYRWAYYSNIYHLVSLSKYDKAQQLINEMTEKFSKEKLPFVSESQEIYFSDLFNQVDKNYR